MKTFIELREKTSKPKGELIYDKKVKKLSTQIYQTKDGRFAAYIDGDRLDHRFRSEKDAKKAIEITLKALA